MNLQKQRQKVLAPSLIRKIMVFLALVSAFAASNNVLAKEISEERENMFANNDIEFYVDCSGSGGGSGVCGDNKNYAGAQVWTDAQMEALSANQPFYESAAADYGFPWQILAVLHMREHSLVRSNPGNGQGVYQFYSEEARASCAGGDFTPGAISDDQFQIQTNCAAQKVAEGYGAGLDLSTDDGVKKMFFRYNGTADVYIQQALNLGFSQEEAENGEGSPYVMNRYDAQREPSSTWGQIKSDGGSIEYPANNDFGAFVYYKAINCGSEGGGGGGDTTGNNILNQAALELSWPDRTHAYTDPNPAYKAAIEEMLANGASGDSYARIGASCDFFIGTVLHKSGYDTDSPFGPASAFLSYLEGSDKYEDVTSSISSEADMQPGDIRSRSGHIEMYVKLSDGTGAIASASHPDYDGDPEGRTGDHGIGYYEDSSYKVFRPKNIPGASGRSNGEACDDTAGDGVMPEGGMTQEQAEAHMAAYASLDPAYWGAANIPILDPPCTGGHLSNCVAYSHYFLARYTTCTQSFLGDGKDIVAAAAATCGIPTGTTPKPYAVFSTTGPSEFGHTGVILGIEGDTLIVGEAGCGNPASWTGAHRMTLAEMIAMNGSATFAYTDSILNLSGNW